MAYCVQCGVKLQEQAEVCPLCGTAVPRVEGEESLPADSSAAPEHPVREAIDYNRPIFVGLLTFFLAAALIITLFIDISLHSRITWSFYTMLSITTSWILFIFPILYRGTSLLTVLTYQAVVLAIFFLILDNHNSGVSWSWYPSLSLLAAAALLLIAKERARLHAAAAGFLVFTVVNLFLFALDRVTPRSWFFPLALPLTAAVFLLLLIQVLIIRRHASGPKLRTLWLGILLGLIETALIVPVTEVIISRYTAGRIILNWSLIPLIALLPLIAASALILSKEHLQHLMHKKFHL